MEENKKGELPMNWWNWWKYVIFPFGILVSIGSLTEYNNVDFSILNLWGWTIVIANLAMITLLCMTYVMFLTKKEQAFNFFITYLFLYPAWNIFVYTLDNVFINSSSSDITRLIISGLISYGIIYGIWIYPNYIYFKKRNNYFIKKGKVKQQKKTSKDIIKKEKKSDNEIKKIERSNLKCDKKYCTRCGKIIENEWVFCNYCGNKLK